MTFKTEAASIPVFNWIVDKQPAAPPALNHYYNSPSPKYLLAETTPEFPSSTMDFSEKTLKPAENLWMPNSKDMHKPAGDLHSWSIDYDGYAQFKFKLDKPVDVFFRVRCSGIPNGVGVAASISIKANGDQLAHTQELKSYDQHLYSFKVSKKDLKTGDNHITLFCSQGSGVRLTAVTLEQTGQCKVRYFWRALTSTTLHYTSQSFSYDKNVQTGVIKQKSETKSMALAFGLDIKGGGIDDWFKKLAGGMSASFSENSSTTHTISISGKSSVSYGFSVKPEPGQKITLQIWQLCLEYETYGHKLIQRLAPDQAPIVPQQFVQTKTSSKAGSG